MEKDEPRRFLSIRLSQAEFNEIYRQYKFSGCRSLTEYAKKVLMKKPVTIRTRNESVDESLNCLTGIRSRLDSLEEHLDEKTDTQMRNVSGTT